MLKTFTRSVLSLLLSFTLSAVMASGTPGYFDFTIPPSLFTKNKDGKYQASVTLIVKNQEKSGNHRINVEKSPTFVSHITIVTDRKNDSTYVVLLSSDRRPTDQIDFSAGFDNVPQEHVTVADICGHSDGSEIQNLSRPKPNYQGIAGHIIDNSSNNGNGNSIQIGIPGGVSGTSTKISTYPNPTSETLNIVTEGEVIWGIIQINDLTGKRVQSTKVCDVPSNGTGTVLLSLSSLRDGIYLVHFDTDKDHYVRRIQVKH
jgi:hypothetical protein